MPIEIAASPEEHELITTDPRELAERQRRLRTTRGDPERRRSVAHLGESESAEEPVRAS
ncbi:MAG: hypothetical protein WKH64_07620 [Chloroflexia bacterium]